MTGLDTKDKSETGLMCLSTFGPREGFVKRGLTMAVFIQEGKMPVGKDWFTSAQRKNLARTLKQGRRNRV